MIVWQVVHSDNDTSTHPTKTEAIKEAKRVAELDNMWARNTEVFKVIMRDDLTPKELVCATLGREAFAQEIELVLSYNVADAVKEII